MECVIGSSGILGGTINVTILSVATGIALAPGNGEGPGGGCCVAIISSSGSSGTFGLPYISSSSGSSGG